MPEPWNHAFIDGNKRIGTNAAITFLLMNGWEPLFDEDELVELVPGVASGVISKAQLTRIFQPRCRLLTPDPNSSSEP